VWELKLLVLHSRNGDPGHASAVAQSSETGCIQVDGKSSDRETLVDNLSIADLTSKRPENSNDGRVTIGRSQRMLEASRETLCSNLVYPCSRFSVGFHHHQREVKVGGTGGQSNSAPRP
jgi:hypothetical protein